MNAGTITSPHNQRVKDAIKLRHGRQRGKQQRTLVDGVREIARALDGGVQLLDVFVCDPHCQDSAGQELLARLNGTDARIWQVTPEVFDRLAFGERQEGVVAVAQTPERTIETLQVPAGGLAAVLCGVEKPGNLGAILRTADAAGVAAVIVADPGTDLYNPNCIRASLGTIFTQQVCTATTAQTLAWLRVRSCKTYAARVDATRSYADVDYRGDAALVLGSEAAGLSPEWQAADVTPIKLQMHGTVDSLNVSATAAVLFYEALRQRGLAG